MAHRFWVELGIGVVLGCYAWWLKSGKDMAIFKKELAKLVGDAVTNVALQIEATMGEVPDDLLRAEADKVYDGAKSLLPEKLATLLRMLYTKKDFEDLVVTAWHRWQQRTKAVAAAA